MQEYQLRVIVEERELKEKVDALMKFTCSAFFKTLPVEDQKLLLEQGKAMTFYGEILKERISRFK